jgi:hypothetical protein
MENKEDNPLSHVFHCTDVLICCCIEVYATAFRFVLGVVHTYKAQIQSAFQTGRVKMSIFVIMKNYKIESR